MWSRIDQGVEVGMVASDPQVTEHDVDLFAGMMDAADAGTSRLRGPAGTEREASPLGGPGAEVCLDQADQPAGIEVADGDQDGVFGGEVTAMVLEDVVARQPGEFADPAPRVAGQGWVP